jgi:YbbR domain-containing protein
VNASRTLRRLGRVIVHNWPLKLGAVVLATLLYAGLVASQDSNTYPGPIAVTPVNQPADTVITNSLRDVEEIRYIAPADLGRLRADDFRATVDLANVKPDGNPVSLRVNVTTADPRVTILEVRPRTIQVTLDQKVSKVVPVLVTQSDPPAGLQVGEVTVTPAEVTVTGPSAAVNRVVGARVTATIDGSGVNVDRDVQPDAVDAAGEVVSGVDLNPVLVHLTIPVYTNLANRTLPVNPIVTGTPAAGFRIASVDVEPLIVSVEGDKAQLQSLVAADTAPVPVTGATRNITSQVAFALPTGVSVIGDQTATVTVHIEAVTETRTFPAGIRLDGRQAGLQYDASETSVLLTLFGSTADLDRLAASPIVISLNVATLAPGANEVPVVPSLPSAVTVAAISPETVTVTVAPRVTPSPATSGAPGPAASEPVSPAPSSTPTPTPAG